MARKLLLADDSITIQKVVELVLAEEDFEIKSVSNGEDALNLMNSFKPDIVLADIEMPKLNGYQLCERIKQNAATSQTPVILLAGAFEPMDEDLARNVGADDSVIKPFESQELISKINAALALSAAGAEEGFAFAEAEAAEEGIEVAEEAVEAAEVVSGEAGEDLWAMEEVAAPADAWASEAIAEEQQAEVEAFELAGEEAPEVEEVQLEEPQAPVYREAEMPSVAQFAARVEAPSKEELLRVFEKTVNEKVERVLASMDLREALLAGLMPAMKESIEKILWEIAPEMVEKTMRELMKSALASLSTEVEKVIWETVPELAGTIISKEIEKIKSEY